MWFEKIKNIVFKLYGENTSDKQKIFTISDGNFIFTAKKGDLISITGSSGIGKTSFLDRVLDLRYDIKEENVDLLLSIYYLNEL